MKMINGIIVKSFITGWWGDKNEGMETLQQLGLPLFDIPFNVPEFLETRTTSFISNDVPVYVSFSVTDEMFVFKLESCGNAHCIKLYREWDGQSLETIQRYESEAIGECVRRLMGNQKII